MGKDNGEIGHGGFDDGYFYDIASDENNLSNPKVIKDRQNGKGTNVMDEKKSGNDSEGPHNSRATEVSSEQLVEKAMAMARRASEDAKLNKLNTESDKQTIAEKKEDKVTPKEVEGYVDRNGCSYEEAWRHFHVTADEVGPDEDNEGLANNTDEAHVPEISEEEKSKIDMEKRRKASLRAIVDQEYANSRGKGLSYDNICKKHGIDPEET